MASLWKHPQSKYWVACFTDRAGRRRKQSTKETDRKKAQKIADEYELATRKERTAAQVRAVIARLHEEIRGESVRTTTVRVFFEKFLEAKTPEVSGSTLSYYTHAKTRFLDFLGPAADQALELVTQDHIVRFRNEQAKTISGKTVNHTLKGVRMILKSARRDGYLTENPAEFVEGVRERAKTSVPKRRPFTVPELQAVLRVASDEWKSLIRFGLYTGQRLGDVATLTWKNLDLPQNEIRLITRKTGRQITVPIAPPLRAHIETLTEPADPEIPLHPTAHAVITRTGRAGGLSNRFAELLATAGLRTKVSHQTTGRGRTSRRVRQALSFHSLRDMATTLLHEAGIPESVSRELIGHDSEAVHQGYVKVGRAALEKPAAAFPLI